MENRDCNIEGHAKMASAARGRAWIDAISFADAARPRSVACRVAVCCRCRAASSARIRPVIAATTATASAAQQRARE
jgi:hypothetical protein